nr:hypothetical protein [Tanacetum cinerariifolium]
MHSLGKTINELHAMLKLHEQTLPKNNAPALHAIRAGKVQKGNYPQYLAELLKKKKNAASRTCGSVFKKEVENQLGKTIKLLRSDSGSEYMSQEFLDHLKDHGIIAHRTPPYTPQHNGMSKRRNKTLLDMVEKTPYEVWHGKARKLSYLKVWGCEALVKRDTLTKPDKLEPKSIKCIFIGYPKEMMGYSFYYPPENKLLVARNAEFLENGLITQEASGSIEDLEIIQEEDTHPSIDISLNHEKDNLEIDEPQSDIVPIRRSTRTRHAPDRMCLYIDAGEHELGDLDNEVWVLVELPPNGKTIGSKWLFKKKTDMDGVVHTYKARLVAKGYTQTPRIGYEETFSRVADIRAIRILIAIAAYYDYEIWQMDVKTALFNGYLNEEVYWSNLEVKLHIFLESRSTEIDHGGDLHWTTVKNILKYLRNTKDMFLVYEDSGYVFILNDGVVDWKSAKQSIFATSSTEAEAITIANESGITKGARHFRAKVHYLREVIEYGNVKLEKVHTDDNLADHFTKALAFPKHSEHTRNIGMLLTSDLKRKLRVSCYTNAGYLTYADELKSQTGYVFVLNDGAVDWKSAKQSIFATLSAEAEYIDAFDASKEAVWVRKFISGLGVIPTIKEPISMYCDNTGAIAITNESGITKGARHFRAKVHYLREVIEYGDVKLEKFHTYDNLADPFTKALAFSKHSKHTRNIGMLPASSLM